MLFFWNSLWSLNLHDFVSAQANYQETKNHANDKRMIKSLRTFQSRVQELCYFPGRGFIRSKHDGSAKGALCTRVGDGRRDRIRHWGREMAQCEKFGRETSRLEIFRIAISLFQETRSRALRSIASPESA